MSSSPQSPFKVSRLGCLEDCLGDAPTVVLNSTIAADTGQRLHQMVLQIVLRKGNFQGGTQVDQSNIGITQHFTLGTLEIWVENHRVKFLNEFASLLRNFLLAKEGLKMTDELP